MKLDAGASAPSPDSPYLRDRERRRGSRREREREEPFRLPDTEERKTAALQVSPRPLMPFRARSGVHDRSLVLHVQNTPWSPCRLRLQK